MFSKKRKHANRLHYFVWVIVLGAFLTSLYSLLHPGQHKSSQIAVIDGDRLWQELPAMKQLKKNANAVLSSHQKTFSRIENKLREENHELIQLQNTYNAKDYHRQKEIDDKQGQFTKKVMQVQAQAEETQQQVNQAYQKAITHVRGHVTRTIHRIANKRGYALVLYKNQSPYFNADLDITNEVFDQLKDLKAPKISVDAAV